MGPPAPAPKPGALTPSISLSELAVPTLLPQIPEPVLQVVEDSLRRYLPDSPPGFLLDAIALYHQGDRTESVPVNALPGLLTAGEARRALGGISPMTLHRLMKSGALPVVRISGRRIGFDPDDIRAFIAARKAVPKRNRRRASA